MESMLLMFLSTVISSMITYATTESRSNKEYQQQKDLLDAEQKWQAEREDIAFQRQKPQQMYQDYLDTGFNPNLAAQAVLGGNAETAQAGASPSAPTTNSAIDAISRVLGQGGQQLYDQYKNAVEIENIKADTNKTDIEAGIMPRDYMLRNLSVTKQLEVWDKSVEKMSSEIGLTDEQTKLVKQQNLYYGRLSESEINLRQQQIQESIAKAQLALEQVNTEKHKQSNLDADTALKHAETDKIYDAEIPNIQADTSLKNAQTSTEWQRTERERIAYEFEKSLGGVPLTADGQKYVMKLAHEGKYDEIKEFYQVVFQSALNQSLGTGQGAHWTTPDWKLGIGGTYMSGSMPITRFQRRGTYTLPYWNPQ